MAESIGIDSARLALSRPLIVFGKASHKFFGVVDSVSCLDSESVGVDSKIALDSVWAELLNLTPHAKPHRI